MMKSCTDVFVRFFDLLFFRLSRTEPPFNVTMNEPNALWFLHCHVNSTDLSSPCDSVTVRLCARERICRRRARLYSQCCILWIKPLCFTNILSRRADKPARYPRCRNNRHFTRLCRRRLNLSPVSLRYPRACSCKYDASSESRCRISGTRDPRRKKIRPDARGTERGEKRVLRAGTASVMWGHVMPL